MNGFRILALSCALCLAAACSQPPQPAPPVADEDVLTPTNSSRDIGNYSIHVNALPTDELTAEVASLYGIARSQNRALLNVSVLRKNPGSGLTPSRATVTVSATNLTGQVRSLTMREITEGDGIYYIGETVITNAETLVFTIEVRPEGGGQSHTLRYMRQFFVD